MSHGTGLPEGNCTDEIVFQLSNFKNEDSEFVSDIRNIVITFFAPYRKLFSNFLSLTTDLPRISLFQNNYVIVTNSILLMRLFSILMSWLSFFANSGAKAPAAPLRKLRLRDELNSLFPFVDDWGGGGVWI
jgi:hypothetical protein